MAQEMVDIDRARDAVRRASWPEAFAALTAIDPAALGPDDLDALADAAWWMCRVEDSIAARRRAYTAHADAGDDRRAAMGAWALFYEYVIGGDEAVAAGWLRRAHRHLEGEPDCIERGWLKFAEAEIARWSGRFVEARELAERATSFGRRFSSPDLLSMGIELQGRCLISAGLAGEGVGLLDEAMCSVVAGELSPMITGWIYCNVIGACWELADLRRASEWTDAAMRWCNSLSTSSAPYWGLCRIHRVEIAALRGRWSEAEAEAMRTCDELLSYQPHAAAEAFYTAGEIRRRMGDLETATKLFERCHELGATPQPGLALVHLARGRVAAAAGELRSALEGRPANDLARVRLLVAQVDVALAENDVDIACSACDELEAIAERFASPALLAAAAGARGTLSLATDELGAAFTHLRTSIALWQEVDAPYEVARSRLLLGTACRREKDEEGARLEFQVALRTFERLGARADLRRTAELLSGKVTRPSGLTPREAEVLKLVATGRSNRAIAEELVVSENTVARHLNNIFNKVGVSSRAAATAFAFEHDLA
ncbi:MAG: helix-turn-helix domain-containing protein [Actinomycetota bacterium]